MAAQANTPAAALLHQEPAGNLPPHTAQVACSSTPPNKYVAARKLQDDTALAKKFCPVVIFDSNEEIRPVTMEDYLSQCSLRDFNTHHTLLKRGFTEFPAPLLSRQDTYLDYQGTWQPVSQDVEDVPFYFKVDRGVHHRGQLFTSILYMFFWPHDLGGLVGGKRVGAHKADLEHIRVLVSPDGTRVPSDNTRVSADGIQVQRVHFAAHGYNEGRWVSAADCHYFDEEGNRVVVYCACHQHASYPRPGKQNRLFFVVPDYADGKGKMWNAHSASVVPYPNQLLHFKGRLSQSIWNGPCQRWWNQLEPETTMVCRFTGGVVNLSGVNGWLIRRKTTTTVVATSSKVQYQQ